MMNQRIGIYSGTFDPIHSGHLSFALAAIQESSLDRVYFLPERSPRHKPAASDYVYRLRALIKTARDYDQLDVLDYADREFTVHETLPQIVTKFPDATLVFLVGSDVLSNMHTWKNLHKLIERCDFAIGVRDHSSRSEILLTLSQIGIDSKRATIIRTAQAHMSSSQIRSGDKPTPDI